MIPIFDLHADVFMDLVRRAEASGRIARGGAARSRIACGGIARADLPDNAAPAELESRHLARIRSGGIFGAVLIDCRMAGETAGPEDLERFIARVNIELDAARDKVTRVRAAADIGRAIASGTFAAIVGYEGLTATGGDLGWIRRLHKEADLRVAVLTHNDDNVFGGGALGERGGLPGYVALDRTRALGQTQALGLTEKGREALALMNELGILVDMAHAGKATRRDILTASTRPVMLSHTSSKAVYDNGRNLSDAEMRAIADKGGLIGCMTSPAALAPIEDRGHHNLERYTEHLLHMINAAGVDHVGLGLHFCEYLYSREEYPPVRGLEDASRAGSIVDALLASGVSEDDVEKIAWKNFAKLFARAVG